MINLSQDVAALFAALDGRDSLIDAYERWHADRTQQAAEDRRLGARRAIPTRKRRPLEERLGELAEAAEKHFAQAAPIKVRKRRKARVVRSPEERRAAYLAYQRDYWRQNGWRYTQAARRTKGAITRPAPASAPEPARGPISWVWGKNAWEARCGERVVGIVRWCAGGWDGRVGRRLVARGDGVEGVGAAKRGVELYLAEGTRPVALAGEG